jgi:hypothetical protein
MTPEDHKWFRVEVSDHNGQIVAIEPGMLAGRDIGDIERAKIHEAIGHLQGFVGQERPRCEGCGNEIDPDWCWCGDAIKGHGHTSNHGPIPMGCDCGRAAQETPVEQCGAIDPHRHVHCQLQMGHQSSHRHETSMAIFRWPATNR